ncbi:hypothetical protein Aperf_G00000086369 [Anoplocephala perfoliata]
MDPEKAERHRQFVSGLSGGTAIELLGLLFIPCSAGYLRLECEQLFFQKFSHAKLLVLDILCIIVAIVLPCTLLSNYILEVNVLLFSTAVIFKLKAPMNRSRFTLRNGFTAWRRLVRSYVLAFTCICIYAVDFPIFPRRFAKTEVSGVSLMDVGVGMIAVAIGVSNVTFLDIAQTKSRKKMLGILTRATIPCLIIGLIRMVTVKSLGYPEHETEYGIHWNFFFTLAFIRFGGILTAYIISGRNDFDLMTAYFALCGALACIQQWIVLPIANRVFPRLAHPGNSAFGALRKGNFEWLGWVIQANAEGIVSLPGYLSLFFYGTAFGIALRLHLEPPKENTQSEEKIKCLCKQDKEDWRGDPKKVSFAVFCISIAMFLVVEAYGESNVSRRLVNLPYIALQIGLMAPSMALFAYQVFTTPISSARGRKDLLPLLSLVADHGTVYFMVANLITGTLNFLFDTLVFVEMQPVWFSTVCQLLLLSIYTSVCPFLAEALSYLVFGGWTASQ